MPTKSPPPKQPSSLERVQAYDERIRAAQASSRTVGEKEARIDRELVEVDEEVKTKRQARLLDATPANVKAEQDAKSRQSALRLKRVELASDSEELLRIIRTTEERRGRAYLSDPEPFLARIEPHIEELRRDAEAVIPALEKILGKWRAIQAEFSPLAPATLALVKRRQQEAGFDNDHIARRDAYPPACPITPELVERLRTTLPRPPALEPDYAPFGSPTEVTLVHDEVGGEG